MGELQLLGGMGSRMFDCSTLQHFSWMVGRGSVRNAAAVTQNQLLQTVYGDGQIFILKTREKKQTKTNFIKMQLLIKFYIFLAYRLLKNHVIFSS